MTAGTSAGGRQSLDEKDQILLGALRANARESLAALARRVGLSRTATHERLRRLERTGVVRGYTVEVEEPDDGSLLAVMSLGFAPGTRCEHVVPQLRQIPQVVRCDSLAGPVDLLLGVRCALSGELERVRETVARIPGVNSVTTHVVLASHW